MDHQQAEFEHQQTLQHIARVNGSKAGVVAKRAAVARSQARAQSQARATSRPMTAAEIRSAKQRAGIVDGQVERAMTLGGSGVPTVRPREQ